MSPCFGVCMCVGWGSVTLPLYAGVVIFQKVDDIDGGKDDIDLGGDGGEGGRGWWWWWRWW